MKEEMLSNVESFIKDIGFIETIKDPCGHGCGLMDTRWIITKYGRYFLYPIDYCVSERERAIWYYGRFEEPSNLPKPCTFANPYSGKSNDYGYTCERIISKLKSMLEIVGARKPTKEEIEYYNSFDIQFFAKWQIERAQYQKELKL